ERAGAAHGPDVAQIRRGARTFPVHAVAGRALTFAVEDRLTPARVAGFPRRRRVEGVHVAEVRDDARDFRGVELERRHRRLRNAGRDDAREVLVPRHVVPEPAGTQVDTGDAVARRQMAGRTLRRVDARAVLDIGL